MKILISGVCGFVGSTLARFFAEQDSGMEVAGFDNFIRAGFADEVAQVRECHAAGDRDAALAAVSDRMVDAIDVLGDAAHVHATVQAYVDAGVEVPIIMPMPWGQDRMNVIADTINAAAGRF